MNKLILFDIDGTLLSSDGRAREAFLGAIQDAYARGFDPDSVSFSGKTDPQILSEILALIGLKAGPGDSLFAKCLDLYRDTLTRVLERSHVRLMPGVADLVHQLAETDGVQLGLLTGNLRETAYLKLRLAGLDRYFPFGAFGSDHHNRYMLPDVAVARAFEYNGVKYGPGEVVIVGDTEHDVCCGRSISAVSVAVCTGRYTRRELERFAPDVLLDDLADPAPFLAAVFGKPADDKVL